MKFLASLLAVLCMAPFTAFAGTVLIDAAHPNFTFSASPCKGNIVLSFELGKAVVRFEEQGCEYFGDPNNDMVVSLVPEVALELNKVYFFYLASKNNSGYGGPYIFEPEKFLVDTKPAAHLTVTNGLLKR